MTTTATHATPTAADMTTTGRCWAGGWEYTQDANGGWNARHNDDRRAYYPTMGACRSAMKMEAAR